MCCKAGKRKFNFGGIIKLTIHPSWLYLGFTTKKWASFYAKIGKQGTIPAEDFNEEEKFTSIEYDNYLRLKKHRDSF